MPSRAPDQPLAVFGEWVASDLADVSSDPSVLDGSGHWAVLIPYAGPATFARFKRWERRWLSPGELGGWPGASLGTWSSSMSHDEYVAGVQAVRALIERGEVYQANLCRILTAAIDGNADVMALHERLRIGNPAPLAGALRLPELGIHVASASPELFLERHGSHLTTRPIKGTAAGPDGLLEKDAAENVMIVDLMRNDLARVCRPGSIEVPGLLDFEAHPGLVHLVSTVVGDLRPGVGWQEILDATMPPGSVTGAPKHAAVEILRHLEPVARGPYCGAFGWVDPDRTEARLAVTIRTFWMEPAAPRHGLANAAGRSSDGPPAAEPRPAGNEEATARLHFGTGAGITWASSPESEWQETQLKAKRLLALAASEVQS